MRKTIKDRLDILTQIAALAGLCLALWAQVQSCNNEAEISRVNYKLRAMQTQPRLKPVGSPSIASVKVRIDSTTNMQAPIQSAKIRISLVITTKMRFANVGNALAKELLYVVSEGAYSLEQIYAGIQTLSDSTFEPHFRRITEVVELLPGDSVDLYLPRVIEGSGEEFTLNFLILYNNELGNLLGTYLSSEYRFVRSRLESQVNERTPKDTIYVLRDTLATNSIELTLSHFPRYSLFDEDEAAQLTKSLGKR